MKFPLLRLTLVILLATFHSGCQSDELLVRATPLPPTASQMRPLPTYNANLVNPQLLPPRPPAPPVVQPPLLPPSPRPPCPEWVAGNPQKWQYIVIHHSAADAGNAASMDRFHRQARLWDELGYHFVITNGYGGSDGTVEIGSRWIKQKHGAHTRVNPNDDNRWNEMGIGICLVGDFNQRRPSEGQMASAARLVNWLMQQSNIPRSSVLGHGQVPGAKTECPGRSFSYDDLFRRIDALNR